MKCPKIKALHNQSNTQISCFLSWMNRMILILHSNNFAHAATSWFGNWSLQSLQQELRWQSLLGLNYDHFWDNFSKTARLDGGGGGHGSFSLSISLSKNLVKKNNTFIASLCWIQDELFVTFNLLISKGSDEL